METAMREIKLLHYLISRRRSRFRGAVLIRNLIWPPPRHFEW